MIDISNANANANTLVQLLAPPVAYVPALQAAQFHVIATHGKLIEHTPVLHVAIKKFRPGDVVGCEGVALSIDDEYTLQ